MQTLFAVLEDLFAFARSALFGSRERTIRTFGKASYTDGSQLMLLPQQASMLRGGETAMLDSPLQSGTLHFIGVPEVAMHTDPVMAFDVIRTYLPYGASVRLLKLGGRWAYVRYKDEEGWILKDILREQARDVLPLFEDATVYDAGDPETKKLRLFIQDDFCGGRASLPLTDAEYVTFKLRQKNLSLPFGNERPRTPGTWQRLLRGKTGVHSGIIPRTGSVMEYLVDDIGYVAYVEAVFPDESIKISSVGLFKEGEYQLQTLSKEQYRELRPIFIEAL